ncbi:hypothetical protein AVEN_26560-1 [Araneus ventricosus]|uniref:Uncharacterized protein n=1 Tax=Araneus ventricosus TaxID=182803 RepID=A0A4Y2FR57_ARAVE|nr:hypothetical protein AVEN_26560-1 [Araneus ventricosus]
MNMNTELIDDTLDEIFEEPDLENYNENEKLQTEVSEETERWADDNDFKKIPFEGNPGPELVNRCPVRKFFVRVKSLIEGDQLNNLVIEVRKCDVLMDNLAPGGMCGPAPYRDGARKTCSSRFGKGQEVFAQRRQFRMIRPNTHELCACGVRT